MMSKKERKEMEALQAEIAGIRAIYLDQPEDRLWHDADQTWWQRIDDTYLGVGALYSAPPPPAIQKLIDDNTKLKAQVKRLKQRLQSSPDTTGVKGSSSHQGVRRVWAYSAGFAAGRASFELERKLVAEWWEVSGFARHFRSKKTAFEFRDLHMADSVVTRVRRYRRVKG